MKRKVIIATLALFVLIAGVVSAASIWGTYKGNDIIRLTVNGDPVKVSDVPVISYNNRTMIPIYLLQQAGISYTWDQKNKTVDILEKSQTTEQNQNYKDVSKLKAYFIAVDLFKKTAALGDMISDLSTRFSLTFDAIRNGNGSSDLPKLLDRLNGVINNYNSHLSVVSNTQKDLSRYGITTDVDSIMQNYYNALDKYKSAYSYIESYNSTYNPTDFNYYLDNAGSGFDLSLKGRISCQQNYEKYRDLIFNY